jgi:hypothetical protein
MLYVLLEKCRDEIPQNSFEEFRRITHVARFSELSNVDSVFSSFPLQN